MKTHTFNGTVYDIQIGDNDGTCDSPNITSKTKPSLSINMDKDGSLRFLETAIHESLHASSFLKSEKRVDQTAFDISRFLWRLGYRVK